MNEMSVKKFCNETLSKTNFPLGRIKVHLIVFILSYIFKFHSISFSAVMSWNSLTVNIKELH